MTEGEVLDNNIVQFPPFTTTTTAIMRQLKHHEKKLLKKVDFLNVSMSRRARSARGPHSRPDLARLTSLPSPLDLAHIAVEAGCVPARGRRDAQVPHPGPRGLPQVSRSTDD